MKELPTYTECMRALHGGIATRLHEFIYEHEPGPPQEEADLFREALLAVINEVEDNVKRSS